jgi:hypothetical protein
MQVMPLGPGLRSSLAGGVAVKWLDVASVFLVIATINTVCFWAVGEALAAEISRPQLTSRSPRMDLVRPLDELDLPRYRVRQTNRGWEIRTKHFVVFSTIGKEKAVWAAGELESVWREMGVLADQWTDIHRQDAFGIGAVGVLLADSHYRSGGRPSTGPRETNYGATIFLNAGDEPIPIEERLPELRREGIATFLRVTQQDQAFPEWVQAGLASYFSGEELPADGIREIQPPRMDSRPRIATWDLRTTSDSIPSHGPDPVESALWVQYLLEGDDGRHAPRFFDALSMTLDSVPRDPHLADERSGSVGPSDRADWSHLERLIVDSTVSQSMTHWLTDRNVGQPIVRPEPEGMTLDERHDRMILILKLARRFASPPGQSIRPKVTEFADDRAITVVSTPPKETAMTPIALYRTLAELPRWVTIDTDGTLLISDNRQRLAEIFAVSDQNTRYRTFRSDGHTVLEAAYLDTGETLEAWLEEDPDNPKRPIGHIRRADHLPAEPPAETATEDPTHEAPDGKQ